MEQKRGFYITTKVDFEGFNQILIRCIESIRRLDDKLIVIINDNSSYEFKRENIPFNNILVIKNEYSGSGEIYPYYLNNKTKLFDQYVVMHDSMILKKKIDNWSNIRPLWYFEKGFKNIPNDKNLENPFKSQIVDHLNDKYDILNRYINQQHDGPIISYYGCFGCCLIIDQNVAGPVFTSINLENLVKNVNTRPQRMMCERLLGILFLNKPDSLNGSIFNHPSNFSSLHSKYSLDELLNMFKHYDSYMIKTWFGR